MIQADRSYLKRRYQKKRGAPFVAHIGHPNGAIWVRGRPGHVYVRELLGTANGLPTYGETLEVRDTGQATYVPYHGSAVRVVWDDVDSAWEIQRGDFQTAILSGYNPAILNPANPYNKFIDPAAMLPLKTYAVATDDTPTTEVAVRNLAYMDYTGVFSVFQLSSGSRPDIGSYAPVTAGTKRLVHLWLSQEDNSLVVSTSTPIPVEQAFDYTTDLKECLDNPPVPLALPIGAWAIANGQTTIRSKDLFADTRQWMNIPGVKHNYTATGDPSTTDDADAAYAVGSLWYNLTSKAVFACFDNTAGAADWKEIGQTAGVDRIDTVYVGKHGSDTNSGLTPDNAKLTIYEALATADTLTTGSNVVSVLVMDSGRYEETTGGLALQINDKVNLIGPAATVICRLAVLGDCKVTLGKVYPFGGSPCVRFSAADKTCYIEFDMIDGRGESGTNTGDTLFYSTTGGSVMIVHCKKAYIAQDGVGIGDKSFGFGHIHYTGDDLYFAGNNSTAVQANDNSTSLIVDVGHILKLDSLAGTTAVEVSNASSEVYLNTHEIEADVAYDVAGTLWLRAGRVTGTKTATGTVHEISSSEVRTGTLHLSDATTLTISSDTITTTQSYHIVRAEGGATSDQIDTINAHRDNMWLTLIAYPGHTIQLTTFGNIKLPGATKIEIDANSSVTLFYDGNDWLTSETTPRIDYVSGALTSRVPTWNEFDTIGGLKGQNQLVGIRDTTRDGNVWAGFDMGLNGWAIWPINQSKLLARQVLAAATTSITFSNIPSYYHRLQLTVNGELTPNSEARVFVQLNGDTTAANYQSVIDWWDPTVGTYRGVFSSIGGNALASMGDLYLTRQGVINIDIWNEPGLNAIASWRNEYVRSNASPFSFATAHGGGVWLSTASITSITITGGLDFAAGTAFDLIGVY